MSRIFFLSAEASIYHWGKVHKILSKDTPSVDPSKSYGDGIVQASFDLMYWDIIDKLRNSPYTPLTYVDNYAKYKIIIIHQKSWTSVTLGVMKSRDPSNIVSSATLITRDLIKVKKEKVTSFMTPNDFSELFHFIAHKLVENYEASWNNDILKLRQDLGAWIYDY